jgi:hypothetical protein
MARSHRATAVVHTLDGLAHKVPLYQGAMTLDTPWNAHGTLGLDARHARRAEPAAFTQLTLDLHPRGRAPSLQRASARRRVFGRGVAILNSLRRVG